MLGIIGVSFLLSYCMFIGIGLYTVCQEEEEENVFIDM